ncbi:MAG: anaerobic ribonucleoside-triphosphate reductase activating protein [Chlorobiaceae bacterium]|jgi:pyruvate formate lyase activating enzyme|nr:anaerobic ribonucleoside-triphosphate reductase activating protein [Chlorobiaceae bacterium]
MPSYRFNREEVRRELPVGGYIPQSFLDYPGFIAAVIFTAGCNFRCPYCHNPELVEPSRFGSPDNPDFEEVFFSIARNRKLLDGVVVTGGEPTLHAALPDALHALKRLGLSIKLDTNGTRPEMIELLLQESLVDSVAMDIKAPFCSERYGEIAGVACPEELLSGIKRSCSLLLDSEVDAVFRCTALKGIHTPDAIEEMAEVVDNRLAVQRFRPGRTLGTVENGIFSDAEFRDLVHCASGTKRDFVRARM